MSADRILEMRALTRAIELGSLAAAARELDLTPSALSKIITRLEGRLGVRLLVRTPRSIRLTEEGGIYLAGARRVLEALEEAEEQLSIAAQRPRGLLRIYSLPTFAYRAAPLLTEFLKQYPEVTIDMQLGSDRLDLVKHGFDIAIRVGPLEDSASLSRKLCETEWVICAAPEYFAHHGLPATPGDLAAHNCLNFSVHTHSIPWQFRDDAGSERPRLHGNFLSNQAELLRLMALQGVGIIRVSDHVVAHDIAAGRLVPILVDQLPGQRDSIWALYRGRGRQSARTRVFLDFLAERLSH